jgi:hypothetical protein
MTQPTTRAQMVEALEILHGRLKTRFYAWEQATLAELLAPLSRLARAIPDGCTEAHEEVTEMMTAAGDDAFSEDNLATIYRAMERARVAMEKP